MNSRNGHATQQNIALPVINACEVYPLDEAARRLRWRRHSVRQALRNGLVAPKFGSRRYVTGQAVFDFIEKLGRQQAEKSRRETETRSPGDESAALACSPEETL